MIHKLLRAMQFFIFYFIDIKTAMRNIFLSIEQEDIHAQTMI